MAQRFRISGSALVWLALLALILPLRWVIAAICAAGFHELCHMLAIYLCGGSVAGLRITERGASMDMGMLSRRRELICALAGPLGSLMLLFAADLWPRLAVCALFHGLYNLLPMYPMDGGRALQCAAACLLGEDRAERISLLVARITCCILLIAGFYGCFLLRGGMFPVFLAGFVICRANIRKFSCKDWLWRVQ